MWLPDNADLQNGLFVKKIPACVASDKLPDRLEVTYVVDGSAMLQSIYILAKVHLIFPPVHTLHTAHSCSETLPGCTSLV